MVSFDIRVALYNVRASGYKDFLSVGEDMLPIVFMVGALPFVDHTMCTLHRAAHGSVLCTSIKEINFALSLLEIVTACVAHLEGNACRPITLIFPFHGIC